MFGEIVRSHRRRLGMSQEDLAEKIGVSVRTIGKIESGRTRAPRPFTVRLLADAFGLSGPERDWFCESGQESEESAAVPGIATPAQLPACPPGFVGRDHQLTRLDTLAELDGAQGRLAAIIGPAGVGKTTLAVYWAHRQRHRFPDGQLYANLHGFHPSGEITPPGDVIRGFLEALQVPPAAMPTGLDALAALFRSTVAGRRLLIVLDNARDTDQVRPLLPASPGCLTVVTSRHRLTGLVACDGAQPLSLDVLSATESRELMARRLGPERLDDEPAAVSEIVAWTAGLPLALAIVSARAATYPDLRLQALSHELRDGTRGLDAVGGGDPGSDLRAVFSWSYRALRPAAARLFRLLGLHPGATISVAAAASLVGQPIPAVRRLLTELVQTHLIVEQAAGRYGFHDLLRAYAIERAHEAEAPDAREEAGRRLLDHYLHGAHAAARAVQPQRDQIAISDPLPGVVGPEFTHHDEAFAWFVDEHSSLLAAVDLSVQLGLDAHVWQLAWCLVTYLDRQGYWHDWAATQAKALAAAERIGDPHPLGIAHQQLARAQIMLGRLAEADRHLRRAVDACVEVGDQALGGLVQGDLARIQHEQGHYREALRHRLISLQLFRLSGSAIGEANALNNLGWAYLQLGDYDRALESCTAGLRQLEELGYREGQAATWHSLGTVHRRLGQVDEAIRCFRRAADIFRELGHRYREAQTIADLGDAYLAGGETIVARLLWQYSVAALDRLGHPLSRTIRARLAARDNAA